MIDPVEVEKLVSDLREVGDSQQHIDTDFARSTNATGIVRKAELFILTLLADKQAVERERDRYYERLEIDRVYRFDAGESVAVPVPLDERHGVPDGIECRDETIRLQDENNARLRARAEAAEASVAVLTQALEPFAEHYTEAALTLLAPEVTELLPYVAHDGLRRWLRADNFRKARAALDPPSAIRGEG